VTKPERREDKVMGERIYAKSLEDPEGLSIDELNAALRWRDEHPRDARRVEARRETERQEARGARRAGLG
jgi:hypothetical protein